MKKPGKLRSEAWFNNPDDPEMTALYLERYLNYGLTRRELQSGKPIIAIAQTGSDLSPCNRHHVELARRIRDGIIAAGGTCLEVPVHPIQETGKRPTAALDRNLAYLSLVETLFGYPLDGVVLTIGCDKTTPALLMAAATVDIPAIAFSVGPMLNGWWEGERAGSGTVIWKARQQLAESTITEEDFMEIAAASAPSVGYCNTMGTATTMNSLAEALGMQLPGSAAIPAPYRERGQMAYDVGTRIVGMVEEDLRPSGIMDRRAFENAIVVNSAIGGSSNAPIHLNAIARLLGVPLDNDDWQRLGHWVPLLVNLQPAGAYLGEDFFRAGGVPAVIGELAAAGLLPHPNAATVAGQTIGEGWTAARSRDTDVIATAAARLKADAGFLNLKGNLFDSALMKTSVIGAEFRDRYLTNEHDPNAFEGRAVVFDGPEEYRRRIDDPSEDIDEGCILVMRGAGPLGYPCGAEVVNMRPPAALIARGVTALPCLGDGRQSGTSGSPSILNAAPEAAAGGALAILRDGDRIRVDLNTCTVTVDLTDEEIAKRRVELDAAGGYPVPDPQSPWQEIFRERVDQFDRGMTLKSKANFSSIATTHVPRNSN